MQRGVGERSGSMSSRRKCTTSLAHVQPTPPAWLSEISKPAESSAHCDRRQHREFICTGTVGLLAVHSLHKPTVVIAYVCVDSPRGRFGKVVHCTRGQGATDCRSFQPCFSQHRNRQDSGHNVQPRQKRTVRGKVSATETVKFSTTVLYTVVDRLIICRTCTLCRMCNMV